MKLELQPGAKSIAVGGELKISLVDHSSFGQFITNRIFARLISPAINMAILLPESAQEHPGSRIAKDIYE